LFEANQQRSGQSQTETICDQVMECRQAEWTQHKLLLPVFWEVTGEGEGSFSYLKVADGNERAKPLPVQATKGEGQDAGRGTVDPLPVIDRQEDGNRGCKSPDETECGHSGGTPVGCLLAGHPSQQRNLKGVSLGWRKLLQFVLSHRL